MLEHLTDETEGVVSLVPVTRETYDAWLEEQSEPIQRWLATTHFDPEPGAVGLMATADGTLEGAVVCMNDRPDLWDWAALPDALPSATYRIDGEADPDMAALGWALGTYRFHRYKKSNAGTARRTPSRLVWPEACDRDGLRAAVRATALVRDLINTPAEDMGPTELAAAAAGLARAEGADIRILTGKDLLGQEYPAIHAVGRAAARAPCLIDIKWGPPDGPKVTLVGKGVCFDTGGLDIKPAEYMRLMKKDMGGAAHALGVAAMVMEAGLAVRLRVLIPAVENSVGGNALRPGDVVRTRKGLTIEIGNTDAEGRVILADALAEAAAEEPQVLIDFATLTGAARVALGTDLPALFCDDDEIAAVLLACGTAEADPLWRLPLWPGYRKAIESKVADLTNDPEGRYGSAITAALFLQRFAEGAGAWAHIDLMAWNAKGVPGRPEGGEAMGMRAVFAYLESRYGT